MEDRYQQVLEAARAVIASGREPTARLVASEAGISLSTYYRIAGSHTKVLREAGRREPAGTAERIIQAASELLAEVGMSNLVMEDVAKRAGISRGTLYRVFPGKPSLFAALARARAPLGNLGPVLKAVAPVPAGAILPSMIQAALPRLLANRGVLRAVLADAAVDGSPGEAGREVVRSLYQELGDYLAQQMGAGFMRRMDPLVAVQSLVGPLLLYSVIRPEFWGNDASAPEPADVVGEMVQLWLRGMAPDSPP